MTDDVPRGVVKPLDFERLARERLSAEVFDFCAGGAGDEWTLRENVRAFRRAAVLPRVLVDTREVSLACEVCGERCALPVMLAPVALNTLVHPEGEVAAARAAARAGTVMVASTMASYAIGEIAGVTPGPLWLQLYLFRDRGLTQELIARAEAAGVTVLMLTVDAPRIGGRDRDVRNGFTLPAGIVSGNLQTLGQPARWTETSSFTAFNASLLESSVTWHDVEWLMRNTRLPVIVKGLMAPDDAEIATQMSVAGVVVSNHGGRQLDRVPASLDALPAVVDRVAGRCPVLLDGGIRRGIDVLVALALGASAVLIGRPYLWGLAVAGEAGVARVLQLLRDELELAMALAGCPTLSAITRELVVRANDRPERRA